MPKPKHKVLGKLTLLKLTDQQVDDAYGYGKIKKADGGYQGTFREVYAAIENADKDRVAKIYDTVLDKLKAYAGRKDGGSYQDWCREVLTANNIEWKTEQ
jgi:hypothetical protein